MHREILKKINIKYQTLKVIKKKIYFIYKKIK